MWLVGSVSFYCIKLCVVMFKVILHDFKGRGSWVLIWFYIVHWRLHWDQLINGVHLLTLDRGKVHPCSTTGEWHCMDSHSQNNYDHRSGQTPTFLGQKGKDPLVNTFTSENLASQVWGVFPNAQGRDAWSEMDGSGSVRGVSEVSTETPFG